MRHLFLGIFILLLVTETHAQRFGKDLYKAMSGAKGFTLALESPSVLDFSEPRNKPRMMAMFRYMLSDNLALRATAGYYYYQYRYSGLVSDNAMTEKFKGDSASYKFNIGIQKSFGYHEKLDPYVGIDLILALGRNTYRDHYEVVDADKTTWDDSDQNGDFKEYYGIHTRIFTIGAMPLVGVNYFVAENFAIGGELGFIFTSTRIGPLKETVSTQVESVTNELADRQRELRFGRGILRLTVSSFF